MTLWNGLDRLGNWRPWGAGATTLELGPHYVLDTRVYVCPSDPYHGLSISSGGRMDNPYSENLWDYRVPCSYLNALSMGANYWGWELATAWAAEMRGKPIASWSPADCSWGSEYTYARCLRHQPGTAFHLTPSGRVYLYAPPDGDIWGSDWLRNGWRGQ